MAHELDFSKGRPAIAYTGEVPWHGFGEAMDEKQPLDAWRVAAGLDWDVKSDPIFRERGMIYGNYSGYEEVPNKRVLSRSDNNAILSVVSDRYKVVQPEEVMSFFKQLIERQGFKMSTAGSLKGGRRIWAMADCAEDFSIGTDKVGAHLLLATSYDGTFSTTAQFTSIRTVCNNTLQFALDRGSEGGIVKIPHNQDFNAWDIQAELGLDASWMTFRNNVTALADHKVTKREAIEFFLTVVGVTQEEMATSGKQLFNVKKLLSIYESGPGAQLPSAKDTAWGLVNAVTYMADHGRRAKDNGARFDSASFGSGANMKRNALRAAIEMTEAA